MKFRLLQLKIVYFLLGCVLAVTLSALVINILIITGIGVFMTTSRIIPTLSLISSILLLLLCIAMFINEYYVVKDNKLITQCGIFYTSLPIENILVIVEEKPLNKLHLQYRPVRQKNDEDFGYSVINIKPELNGDFVKILLSKNENIKYKAVNINIDDNTIVDDDNLR
ncbi:MAG: PH domain-containing protein [Clostridia bacterium]